MVQNPDTLNKHVREGEALQAGVDNILVLSTCTVPSNDSARYLVVGKLISTQPAKAPEVTVEVTENADSADGETAE